MLSEPFGRPPSVGASFYLEKKRRYSFLAKLFLNRFVYVIGMVGNEISSRMLLMQTISIQFNDIYDKISQEFLIFCVRNSLKCRAFFCT